MKHQTDLGKDRIPILVLKLAIPSMIAQFVTVLYSIIDRMFTVNNSDYLQKARKYGHFTGYKN